MRTALLLTSLILPAALLAGCSDDVPRVGGTAGPVTAAPVTPASAPAAAPTSEAPAATTPATSSPTTPPGERPAKLVLGPNGYGTLKIGMTRKQAEATGTLGAWSKLADTTPPCNTISHLKAAGGKKDEGVVYLSDTVGIAAINVWAGVETAEGIEIGDTVAVMKKAYPDWYNVAEDDQNGEGRGFADTPGNSAVRFRIQTKGGKVTGITLQSKDQDCYE